MRKINLTICILLFTLLATSCHSANFEDGKSYIAALYTSPFNKTSSFLRFYNFNGVEVNKIKLSGQDMRSIIKLDNEELSTISTYSKDMYYIANGTDVTKFSQDTSLPIYLPVNQDYHRGVHAITYQEKDLAHSLVSWNNKLGTPFTLKDKGFMADLIVGDEKIYVMSSLINENRAFIYIYDINTGEKEGEIELISTSFISMVLIDNVLLGTASNLDQLVKIDLDTYEQSLIPLEYGNPRFLDSNKHNIYITHQNPRYFSVYNKDTFELVGRFETQLEQTIQNMKIIDGKMYIQSHARDAGTNYSRITIYSLEEYLLEETIVLPNSNGQPVIDFEIFYFRHG